MCDPSAGLYAATNMSNGPGDVNDAPPKLTVPTKRPPMATRPSLTATVNPESSPLPPKRLAHSTLPLASYLTRNMSAPPALVSEVVPTVSDPRNDPITYTLPDESAATSFPASESVPPIRRDHVPAAGQAGVVAEPADD